MLEFLQAISFSFAALFPVLNPIGSSVIILALLQGAPSAELNKLAYKIALYTAIMLIAALVSGAWILRLFGISIPIVLIGGGLVLAYIGWQLLNQPATPRQVQEVDTNGTTTNVEAMTFYPLTMPVTAGPGCIAVVIALGAHSIQDSAYNTFLSQLGNSIGIMLVAVTVYLCYRYSHVIAKKIGQSGTAVIMRLAAFFNLCIGLELMWHGFNFLMHMSSF